MHTYKRIHMYIHRHLHIRGIISNCISCSCICMYRYPWPHMCMKTYILCTPTSIHMLTCVSIFTHVRPHYILFYLERHIDMDINIYTHMHTICALRQICRCALQDGRHFNDASVAQARSVGRLQPLKFSSPDQCSICSYQSISLPVKGPRTNF